MRNTYAIGIILAVSGYGSAMTASTKANSTGAEAISAHNVVWDSPSKRPLDSMPVGNGDIGLNVWVEPRGDLLFYIGKTDAWSENGRLLKLGRVRVALSPNPFAEGSPFRQTLHLESGEIRIVAGKGQGRSELRIWVDAHRPVVRVETTSESPVAVTATLEPWRTEPRTLKGKEVHSAYSMAGGPEPIVVKPDTVRNVADDRIVWYHRNESSCWPVTMRLQGLEAFMERSADPLLHRTFGGAIRGTGMKRIDSTTLKSLGPSKKTAVSVYPMTLQAKTIDVWLAALAEKVEEIDRVDWEDARLAHHRWWQTYWDRSYLLLASESPGATKLARRYTLQRYMSACGGRGAYPIKFNGSIFTTVAHVGDEKFDADYRRWGGCYWFQNTRLMYWPMLATGDFELMRPLFGMFLDALPLAKARVERYFGHGGAMVPETMTFWGTYANSNYGWDREGKPVGLTDNRYIRWYYDGQLELLAIMLDYWSFTRDRDFAKETLLPLGREIVRFFDEHYPRDDGGTIRLHPAQALETWHEAVNPLPEIAGLRFCLPRLLALPEDLTTSAERAGWKRMLGELPPLPTRQVGETEVLAAAEKLIGPVRNSENPELYAIFPFRLYGVGKEGLDFARKTFAQRRLKGNRGWRQDETQAALLGLAGEAANRLVDRASDKYVAGRFPVFWGPNFDWIPDQDHGSNLVMGLQTMLMQCEGKQIRLLPAWPKEWDVRFRLHAPFRTTVEGAFQDGQWKRLHVVPARRAADVIRLDPQ